MFCGGQEIKILDFHSLCKQHRPFSFSTHKNTHSDYSVCVFASDRMNEFDRVRNMKLQYGRLWWEICMSFYSSSSSYSSVFTQILTLRRAHVRTHSLTHITTVHTRATDKERDDVDWRTSFSAFRMRHRTHLAQHLWQRQRYMFDDERRDFSLSFACAVCQSNEATLSPVHTYIHRHTFELLLWMRSMTPKENSSEHNHTHWHLMVHLNLPDSSFIYLRRLMRIAHFYVVRKIREKNWSIWRHIFDFI